MARSVEIAKAFVTIEAQTKGLDQQLSQVEKSFGRTASFIQAHPIAALGALGVAAFSASLKLAQMAEQTNRAIGVIADRVPGATGKIDELRGVVSQLAIQYGKSHDQIISTMDAVSRAGVRNAQELVQVTEAAIRAGEALGENGEELVGGLDAALDIFGIAAKDATAVMVQFFAAAEGRTSVKDLLDTVVKLAPAIQGTGLDLRTTTQALAALIDQGFEPGKKVIAEFNDRLKNGGVPAIKELAAAAGGSGGGAEAMDKFNEAVKRSTESMESNAQRAKSELKAALLELGDVLIPITAKLTSLTAKAINFGLAAGSTSPGALFAAMGAAAARATKPVEDVAAGLQRVGEAGGIAAGAGEQLAATLTAAKNAAGSLSQAATADLVAYKKALEQVSASGKADAEQKQLLIKVTEELAGRRKKAADAEKQANAEIAASSKALLELKKDLGKKEGTFAQAQANMRLALELKLNENLAKLRGKDFAEGQKLATEALAEFDGRMKQANKIIEDGYAPRVKVTEQTTKLTTKQSDLNAAVGRGSLEYGRLTNETNEAADAQRKFADDAAKARDTIAGGADAFLAMAEAAGIASEEVRSIVGGIVDLADSFVQIAGALTTGDILSGIGRGIAGLTGIIGGLFGESKAERELREALDRNRRSLEELSRNVGDLNISLTGNQLSGSQEALKEFFASGGALTKGWGDRLGQALLKRGLTLSDLDEVAKTLQIELRPNGHLSPQALQQLLEALGLIEPTTFEQDFRGQREKVREETDLFDLSPEQQANKIAALVAGFTKGGTAAAFGGLDFSTKQGRDAAIATLQDLFKNFEKLPVSELGGLTPTEFLDVLQELVDLIESIQEDAESKATEPPVTAGGTGTTPSAEKPVPVEPLADPAFTPDLEAQNWEALLRYTAPVPGYLEGILAAVGGPPVPPPSLPPLGNLVASAPSGPSVQVTVNIAEINASAVDAISITEQLSPALLEAIQRGLRSLALDTRQSAGDASR